MPALFAGTAGLTPISLMRVLWAIEHATTNSKQQMARVAQIRARLGTPVGRPWWRNHSDRVFHAHVVVAFFGHPADERSTRKSNHSEIAHSV
jgi:hypothetical protein